MLVVKKTVLVEVVAAEAARKIAKSPDRKQHVVGRQPIADAALKPTEEPRRIVGKAVLAVAKKRNWEEKLPRLFRAEKEKSVQARLGVRVHSRLFLRPR